MATKNTAPQDKELFGRIARNYDFLNHLLSFNIDQGWRKKLVRSAGARPGDRILDVCVGTGDVAIRFAHSNRAGQIVGIDLTDEMLRIARRKIRRERASTPIKLLKGNGLNLPFPDCSFDIVSIGFGLRNLGHHKRAVSEMVRVVKPGGRLLILEFSPPENNLFGRVYGLYLNTVIRGLGGIVSGSAEAYRHLSTSIANFPKPEEVLELMKAEGLGELRCERLNGGIACIYRGQKGKIASSLARKRVNKCPVCKYVIWTKPPSTSWEPAAMSMKPKRPTPAAKGESPGSGKCTKKVYE